MSSVVNAEDMRTQKLSVESGKPTLYVKDSISGDQSVEFLVQGFAGQHLSVNMSTDSGSNYFNLLPPDTDVALAIGSIIGNSWSGTLPTDGNYRIRVYLMRGAVRRHESARFTLAVALRDGGSVGHAVSHDAKVKGTPFNAKGMLSCSVGPDPKGSARCSFGVIRHGTGRAELRLATPGNDVSVQQRGIVVLHFDGKRVTGANASKHVQARHRGDDWDVSVDDFYFFTIPDAVINGG